MSDELNIPEALIRDPFQFKKGIAIKKGIVEGTCAGIGVPIANVLVPYLLVWFPLIADQEPSLIAIVVAGWTVVCKSGRNVFANVGK